MEKKKKSIITIILNLLVILIFIVAVAVGGVIGFMYFKYDVNVFECIDQVSKLNSAVNVEALATNRPTEADYNTIQNKISDAENGSVTTMLTFSDKELCAYLIHNLDQIAELRMSGMTFNVNDFEIIQIKLSDIDVNQPSEHFCDMNVVLKLNITSLKAEKLNGFPMSLLKNFIPDELYISADCKIDKDGTTYKVTPIGLTVNNLSPDKTQKFFANINKFTPIITADELNRNISSLLAGALIGNDGVYARLHEYGATGYGWQRENYFVVYFVDLSITHSITYHDPLGADNSSNLSTYTIENNIITLNNLTCPGYKFLGWYSNVNDENTKVTTIDASLLQDYDLTCKWEIIEYTITCNLNGGKIGESTEYSRTYTVETETFDLPNTATKEINPSKILDFHGWCLNGTGEIMPLVTIEKGSLGDKYYVAHYYGEEVDLTLVVDGITVHTMSVEAGTSFSRNEINELIEDKLAGYTISNWYTTDSMANVYNYSEQIVNEQKLYATSTYLTDKVYFYPYLTQFKNAVNHTQVLTITSYDMLFAYIDYCVFFDIQTRVNLTLDYPGANNGSISAAFTDYTNSNHIGISCPVTLGENAFFVSDSSDSLLRPMKHFDGSDFPQNINTQQDYALRAPDDLNVRADDYDSFEIKFVGKKLTVSTSEQLVWALENGYQPICDPSSKAEIIYNAAKNLLRKICTDEMNDIQKLQAIYQWLALNVNYDQEALAKSDDIDKKYSTHVITEKQYREACNELKRYDSWYAEGVFFYHKAVCEGYAKALLILAKLEGIPTIRVSGDGHMWNRVYLDGKWYGIDATHGDLQLRLSETETVETFTYTAFLFTDEYKSNRTPSYTADNYTEFVANTLFNAYDCIKFTYLGTTYDLFIDSQAELNALINYVNGFSVTLNDCDFYTLEIATDYSVPNIDSWVLTHGWQVCATNTDSNGNNVYLLMHDK